MIAVGKECMVGMAVITKSFTELFSLRVDSDDGLVSRRQTFVIDRARRALILKVWRRETNDGRLLLTKRSRQRCHLP